MPDNLTAILRGFAAPFAGDFAGAQTILEIGTGTGAFIPVLQELAPATWLVSTDLAGAMLGKARLRCPDSCLAQVDTHQLPFSVSSFGLVTCHNSFPHFADKPRALREILRVLRPGGQLLILHNNSREFVNAIHTRAGAPIDVDLLPPGDEMARLLAGAGFTGVQVDDAPTHYVARGRRT
jgi:demethylmenaquinone methyltransferase/2-methoxy-6-polyprenyl-1,4-benzoquinol methylase